MAEGELQVSFKPIGNNGKGIATALLGNVPIHTAKMDITLPAERIEFHRAVCAGRHDIDRDVLTTTLEGLAGSCVEGDSEESGDKQSQSQALVQLADGAELCHDSENTAYATLLIGDHHETHPVAGKSFRLWLQGSFYKAFGKPANAQAMQDALGVLAGKAIFEGPELPVAVRVAQHDGAIWLDLCDDQWRAVQITSVGWVVVENPPVRFIRKRGMQALPVPVTGGRIEDLRPLLNAEDDAVWVLIVAWLTAAIRPVGPYPVLAVNGEQGSAKSTLCRMLRRLIDPNEADLRSAPRDDRDMMIAATNAWVVAFDNLSHISPALSDAACRLATGGGFATRELYSNDEEKLFNAARPIMFNGIEELATRPDLLERSAVVNLASIPDRQRRTEAQLWSAYERARPGVLGALLTAVATAMRNLSSVRLDTRPRMADFAEWIVAAEPALPWQAGTFISTYAGNRDAANELAVESSAVGPVVLAFIGDRNIWQGSAKDLLATLEADGYADQRTRQRQDWPKTPKALSNALRRIAPTLRRLGVETTFETQGRGNDRRRIVQLEKVGTGPSPCAPSSPDATERGSEPTSGDDAGTVGDGGGRSDLLDRPQDNPLFDAVGTVGDGGDGGDGANPAFSIPAEREAGEL